MRVPIACVRCNSPIKWMSITDDGVYKHKCRNCSMAYQICNNEKFEILFEKGIEKLVEGDSYSAITCFSTALERFYEFSIKVMLSESEIEEMELDETFKRMNRSSERELGAFYMLYLKEFLKACPTVTKSNIELRNKVVHKGYIPTYSEALKYGESVLNYIRDIKNRLESKYSKETIYKVIFKRVFDLKKEISENEKIDVKSIDTFSFPTIIGLLIYFEEQDKVTLEQYLNMKKESL